MIKPIEKSTQDIKKRIYRKYKRIEESARDYAKRAGGYEKVFREMLDTASVSFLFAKFPIEKNEVVNEKWIFFYNDNSFNNFVVYGWNNK